MEERVPPTLNRIHEDDENEFLDSNSNSDHHHHSHYNDNDDDDGYDDTDNTNNGGMMQIVPSSRDRSHETYIIQIPKDQIYRVPPPENAEIVERFRRPVTTNKTKRTRCAYWSLSIFFILAFLISVIVCVHHFTLNPKPPTFTVHQLLVKQQPPAKKPGGGGTAFHVLVHVENPNKVNALEFKAGTTSLHFKGKQIAKGKLPTLDKQEPGDWDNVETAIKTPSKEVLPMELQPEDHTIKSSHGSKKKSLKAPGSFNFEMVISVPVKMDMWLGCKDVDLKVHCEFEVDSLGEKSRILSQNCHV